MLAHEPAEKSKQKQMVAKYHTGRGKASRFSGYNEAEDNLPPSLFAKIKKSRQKDSKRTVKKLKISKNDY